MMLRFGQTLHANIPQSSRYARIYRYRVPGLAAHYTFKQFTLISFKWQPFGEQRVHHHADVPDIRSDVSEIVLTLQRLGSHIRRTPNSRTWFWSKRSEVKDMAMARDVYKNVV